MKCSFHKGLETNSAAVVEAIRRRGVARVERESRGRSNSPQDLFMETVRERAAGLLGRPVSLACLSTSYEFTGRPDSPHEASAGAPATTRIRFTNVLWKLKTRGRYVVPRTASVDLDRWCDRLVEKLGDEITLEVRGRELVVMPGGIFARLQTIAGKLLAEALNLRAAFVDNRPSRSQPAHAPPAIESDDPAVLEFHSALWRLWDEMLLVQFGKAQSLSSLNDEIENVERLANATVDASPRRAQVIFVEGDPKSRVSRLIDRPTLTAEPTT